MRSDLLAHATEAAATTDPYWQAYAVPGLAPHLHAHRRAPVRAALPILVGKP